MRRILKSKIYLYLTEFFAGMSVMAVELGASRLLAPYFSSSQIVWTIIIATIMIAMALGNVYGGRSADRDPNPDRLYRRLLIASIWIAAIPVLGKYLIIGVTGLLVVTVSHNLLVLAAFAACLLIFVFPCFLLGTCTPSLVRYTVSSAADSGSTVGKLGACNTVGSILGTFLPTFVTIPSVGTSVTFLIFSGVLLALSLIYFLSGRADAEETPPGNPGGEDPGGDKKNREGRRPLLMCVIAAALFAVCTALGSSDSFAFWESGLTYEGESVYNYLQVKDGPNSTVLSTNVLFGVQSVTMKDYSLTGMYYDCAMAAPVMAGDPSGEDLLILGMGSGTYARQCLHYFGKMNIRGVEIDEKITELARKYFDEPEEAEVIAYDGRAYIDSDRLRYDVIMVDAYQDITIPFQMSSREFFTSVRDHLKDGGVMVVNMNMRSRAEDGINTYLADTIASVFPHVCTADVPGSTNRELFASMEPFSREAYLENVNRLGDPALKKMLLETGERLVPYEGGGRILTDDRAPVELLGMRAIDEIIEEELVYYKDQFERYGISGLLS